MPYDPALRTPQADIEERIGVIPLEELLSERDDIVKELAPLRAQHGPGGVWDDLRRVHRATLAMKHRATAIAAGIKVTESYLEDAALADPEYLGFIEVGTLEKIKHAELEARIQAIEFTINRGQAIAKYLTAEISLTPR